MVRARRLVENHIAAYGCYVPYPDKLKEAIAADLAFVAVPHRDDRTSSEVRAGLIAAADWHDNEAAKWTPIDDGNPAIAWHERCAVALRALAQTSGEANRTSPMPSEADICKVIKDVRERHDLWQMSNNIAEDMAKAVIALLPVQSSGEAPMASSAPEIEAWRLAWKAVLDASNVYNERLTLARKERERGNWSIKLDEEYKANDTAQRAEVEARKKLYDALTAMTGGS